MVPAALLQTGIHSPKRAQSPFTKEYRSRRRLATDLRAQGETPSCFSPQIHIFRCYFWPLLCSLPGLSRITEFHLFLFMFREYLFLVCNYNEASPCISSARRSGNPGANTIRSFPWHRCHGVFLWGVQRLCHPSKTLQN